MNTTACGPRPGGAMRSFLPQPATGRAPILRPHGKPVPTTSILHGCFPRSSAGWREPSDFGLGILDFGLARESDFGQPRLALHQLSLAFVTGPWAERAAYSPGR